MLWKHFNSATLSFLFVSSTSVCSSNEKPFFGSSPFDLFLLPPDFNFNHTSLFNQQQVSRKYNANSSVWPKSVSIPELGNYKLRAKEPKLCVSNNDKTYSGYLDIGDNKHFFFWFFEAKSKRKDAPLLLWLNGGPGCSSLLGLFTELGPCRVNEHGNDTIPNNYSWNDDAHVIFLDQPLNVGFSHGSDAFDSFTAGEDVFAFLQLFTHLFPDYSSGKLHVFGESYGGHYVPAVAKAIMDNNEKIANKNKREDSILKQLPLESIGIGNGLVDVLEQYKYYGKMACNSSYPPVLSQQECDKIDSFYSTCSTFINACYKYNNTLACLPSTIYCNNNMMTPYNIVGLNPYDVRLKCEGKTLCYPILGSLYTYLNRPEVIKELGSDTDTFELCSQEVQRGFLLNGDWMKPYMHEIPRLLESGVRVLVYAGDADWICNWYGNKAWVLNLPWSGKDKINNTPDLTWESYNAASSKSVSSGEHRTFGPFTFLRVFEAGHMVPYDQPEASLDMINRWLNNKSF
ncbi:hypothetical protein BB559_001379 [Furculomyces boomerangus]|uniref:Carboxypeptidase n=1 Tax=Furculomyces boomerangus TaxID=61424 RepID=A0A2T9Z261_9FUNG|nr:hypothetical protein BB559_001379 [Furculomyces boomerangus]